MLISDLLSHLAIRHGDVEILFSFDSVLAKAVSVELLNGAYEEAPPVVIYLQRQEPAAISR
jgi:hypothetical protein